MRYGRSSVVFAVAPLVTLSLIASPAFAQSPQKSGQRDAPRALAKDAKERASGVILKVERIENGATRGKDADTDAGRARGASRRLTINTAAVWRDWARDQARATDTGPASKDAKEGKNSVATRGEPADRNTMVVIDVVADTAVETRFPALDDESDAGAKTPPTAASDKDKSGKRSAAKPVRFKVEDLKSGLFVQVDYRHVSPRSPASKVVVIRPITSPSAADGAAGNDTKAGK